MKSKHLIITLLFFIIVIGYYSFSYNIFAESSVSGSVKENLGENVSSTPIKGIRVTLTEKNTGEKYSTVSGEDGNYLFPNVTPGNYNLEFKYGDITVLDDFPDENLSVQDILKYNGQDYIASNMNGVTVELAEQVIPQIGKTAAQVFFVLDNSGSMRLNSKGTPFSFPNPSRQTGSDGPSRLDIVKVASKSLIEKIFSQDENIYMGLIKFSTSPTMLSHMCRDTEGLQNKIDELEPEGTTFVAQALEYARSSFVDNDGAKIIIFLSDGTPTDRPQSQVKEEIKKIRNEGIEIFSLIVKDDISESNMSSIFSDSTKLVFRSSGDELADCLSDYIPAWIKQTVDEIRSQQEISTDLPTLEYTPDHGIEDINRREKVDNYFSNIFHYNTKFSTDDMSGKTYLFKCLNKNNSLTKKELRYFSKHTYMTVTYNNINVHENTKLTKLNLKLQRRDPFLMEISVKAIALRITLSDNTVLYKDINTDDDYHIFYTSLDEDLAHGSFIEVEYEVTIKNNSKSIICTHLELLSYLPKELTLLNSQKLITSPNVTNAQNGWYSVDIDELYKKGCISESLHNDDELMNRDIAMFNLDYSNGLCINPGTEYKTRFITSICLANANQMTFDTKDLVEVLGYKNNKYRRMEVSTSADDNNTSLSSLYPGDGVRTDVDFAEDSNTELVVPPTGISKRSNKSMFSLIKTAISLFIK